MKKISELVVSPAPWKHGYKYVSDDVVFDTIGGIVAEARTAKDAQLCAAAPELYEACRKLVAWDGMRDASIEDIIAEAKAACAKAGGAE